MAMALAASGAPLGSPAAQPPAAAEVYSLVAEHCPQLWAHVEQWLQCYRDPALLLESLRREYVPRGSQRRRAVAWDSDSEGEAEGLSSAVAMSISEGEDEGLSLAVAMSLAEGEDEGLSSAAAMSMWMDDSRPLQPSAGAAAAAAASSGPARPPSPARPAGGAPPPGLRDPVPCRPPAAAGGGLRRPEAAASGCHIADDCCIDDDIALALALSLSAQESPRRPPSPARQAATLARAGEAAAPAAREGPGGDARAPRQKLYKVKVCSDFQQGRCRRGEDCTFAHGEAAREFALGEAEREFWNATRRFDRPGLPSPPAAALGPSGAAASGKWPRADSPGFLTMCPLDIGFCQDSISPAFRNGSSILATLRQLADCSMDIREMPPMQVVLHDEKFFSVSNRRLCLYRLCQLLGLLRAVKVQLLQGPPPHFEQKLTTPCEGAWVRVRGDGRICGRTLEETTFGREELLSPASPG